MQHAGLSRYTQGLYLLSKKQVRVQMQELLSPGFIVFPLKGSSCIPNLHKVLQCSVGSHPAGFKTLCHGYFPESWSSWSEWSHCDSSGAQLRVRHCNVLFPTGNQCSGNSSETRPCSPDSNFIPGDNTHMHSSAPCRHFIMTLMHGLTHKFKVRTHRHLMLLAVIQFSSKNPVIIKCIIDFSKRGNSMLEVRLRNNSAF